MKNSISTATVTQLCQLNQRDRERWGKPAAVCPLTLPYKHIMSTISTTTTLYSNILSAKYQTPAERRTRRGISSVRVTQPCNWDQSKCHQGGSELQHINGTCHECKPSVSATHSNRARGGERAADGCYDSDSPFGRNVYAFYPIIRSIPRQGNSSST